MASVKLKFLEKKLLKNGTHPVALQVIHDRKKKLFYLGHSLNKSEWDNESNQPNNKSTNYRLLKARIKSAIIELESIILELETSKKSFTIADIEVQYRPEKFKDESSASVSFSSFIDNIVDQLKKENRIGNANAFQNTKSQFNGIFGEQILLDEIDENLVREFIHKMTLSGLVVNSRAVHLRELRALINKAIKAGLYDESKYPFKNISIKTQKTRKRAVNKDIIKMVEELDVSKENNLQLYKDLFMFSFYTRGMNFVDMAFLKVKNIEGDRLNYRRQKTGQQFSIKIAEKAKTVIDRYNNLTDAEAYLFPIIFRKENEYLDYKNAMRLTNKKLKKMSEILKLDVTLTTYVTRHSWATIAKRSGISTSVISEGLGHTTEEITQVYLDSFENDVLDDANELIIS